MIDINSLSLKREPKVRTAKFIVFVATIIYFIFLNFNIGFLTLDEFAHALNSRNLTLHTALYNGRTSHFISAILNQFFGFSVPDVAGLLPRFLSLVALYCSLILILREIKQLSEKSVYLASFCVLAHQIDWQHNGMVAFFGNYNWYLAFFLLSLRFELKAEKKLSDKTIGGTLLFLSFASELFLGLAALILTIRWLLGFGTEILAKSSWIVPILTYVTLFLVHRQFIAEYSALAMNDYLYGAIGNFSLFDVFRGAWLYTFYSIPGVWMPANLFGSQHIFGLLIILSAISICFFLILQARKNNTDYLKKDKSSIILFAFVGIAIVPQHLMAIQPLKLKWILDSASNRYAFSFYTWISIVVLASYLYSLLIFSKQRLRANCHVIGISVATICTLFTVASVLSNIKFVAEVRSSKDKWVSVQELAKTKKGVLAIPRNLLEHPYILPISDDLMRRYVKSVYKKQALICRLGESCTTSN